MKDLIKVFLLILFLTISNGAIGQIWKFIPVLDPKTDDNLITLAKGETPKIILCNSLQELLDKNHTMGDDGYEVIGTYMGHPAFKKSKNEKRVMTAARKAGATMVLSHQFISNTFFVTKKNRSPKETPVQMLMRERSANKARLGVKLRDLTISERQQIERNKGAYVLDVLEDSPAFEANIIPGDILIKVNGLEVKNTVQAVNFIGAADKKEDLIITVIRKGQERQITVAF